MLQRIIQAIRLPGIVAVYNHNPFNAAEGESFSGPLRFVSSCDAAGVSELAGFCSTAKCYTAVIQTVFLVRKIHLMSLLLLTIILAPLLWFILRGLFEIRETGTAIRFFQFGEPLDRGAFAATLLASNTSLAGAIYLTAIYGFLIGPAAAIWSTLFFALTMIASAKLLGTINARYPRFFEQRGTLHEFLGMVYESSSVRLSAAVASTVVYVALVACELVLAGEVLSSVLTIYGFTGERSLLLSLGLGALVIVYTSAAGFRAVIKTEKVQITFMALMMLAGAAMIFQTSHIAGVFNIVEAGRQLFGDSLVQLIVYPKTAGTLFEYLFLFVFLNIVFWASWWPVAMDQWHRCAATQSSKIPLDKVSGTLGIVPLLYLGSLATVFALLGSLTRIYWGGDGTSPLSDIILGYFSDFGPAIQSAGMHAFVLGLFLAGLLSAIVSTIDSYLVVAAQTWLLDIRRSKKYSSAHQLESSVSDDRRELKAARACVLGLGICSLAVCVLFSMLYDVYEAIYATFAIQLSSIGALLFALLVRRAEKWSKYAKTSIIASMISAVILMGYVVFKIEVTAGAGEDPTGYYAYLYIVPEVVMLLSALIIFLPWTLSRTR